MATTSDERKPRRRRRWLLIGTALLAVLVLARLLVFDIRRIPTSSMAPTLIGAEVGGDRVLVDRLTLHLRGPERYEIVALRHPLDPQRELVKRVVALPQEKIRVADGDLFVNGKRLRKTPAEIARLRIPLFRSDRRAIESEFEVSPGRFEARSAGGHWLRSAAGGPIVLSAPRASTDGYEDASGEVHRGDHVVTDLQIEARAAIPGAGSLVLELGDGRSRLLARIAKKDGAIAAVTLTRVPALEGISGNGASREAPETLASAPWPAWKGSEEHDVTFTNFDCRISLAIDGVEAFPPVDFEEHKPWVASTPGPVVPTLRSVGVGAEDGDVVLASLALYRDLHFVSKGRFATRDAFELGPHQYFVLGDHSGDSDDSRSFGAVESSQVVGLLRATVFPFSRTRRLP